MPRRPSTGSPQASLRATCLRRHAAYEGSATGVRDARVELHAIALTPVKSLSATTIRKPDRIHQSPCMLTSIRWSGVEHAVPSPGRIAPK